MFKISEVSIITYAVLNFYGMFRQKSRPESMTFFFYIIAINVLSQVLLKKKGSIKSKAFLASFDARYCNKFYWKTFNKKETWKVHYLCNKQHPGSWPIPFLLVLPIIICDLFVERKIAGNAFGLLFWILAAVFPYTDFLYVQNRNRLIILYNIIKDSRLMLHRGFRLWSYK